MKAHDVANLRISPVGELDDDLSVLYRYENVVGLQGRGVRYMDDFMVGEVHGDVATIKGCSCCGGGGSCTLRSQWTILRRCKNRIAESI